MIPQSIKDAIDEYRVALFESSTPSHVRERLEDAIADEMNREYRAGLAVGQSLEHARK